ncbi:MAG: hypothetical protein ABIH34_06315 [Nanoarchaeota archaeon]
MVADHGPPWYRIVSVRPDRNWQGEGSRGYMNQVWHRSSTPGNDTSDFNISMIGGEPIGQEIYLFHVDQKELGDRNINDLLGLRVTVSGRSGERRLLPADGSSPIPYTKYLQASVQEME